MFNSLVSQRVVLLLLYILLTATACSSSSGGNSGGTNGDTDTETESPGSVFTGLNKEITTSAITTNSFTVSWNKPDVESSIQQNIQYRVYVSEQENLESVNDIESNGTPIHDWQTDISEAAINSLESAKKYYVNILTRHGTAIESYQQSRQATLASGILDVSFNNSGVFRYDAFLGDNEFDSGVEALVDDQDNIYILGNRRDGSSASISLMKLTQDGVIDTNFGVNGLSLNRFGETPSSTFVLVETAILDSSGRVVAAGAILNAAGDTDISIWRYNTDGSIDMTFGPDDTGFVSYNNLAGGNANDRIYDITLDADDNIYVTGFSASTAPNTDMFLMKLTSDGAPDATFGTNGVVTHNGAAGGSYWERGNVVKIDNNNRILVGGSGSDPSNGGVELDMVLWRFSSDGSLDPDFGVNGVVVSRNPAGYNSADQAFDVLITEDDHILVTGYTLIAGGDGEMIVWRFTDNGFLDITFGSSGTVILGQSLNGNRFDLGHRIYLDDADGIIVAGYGSSTASSGNGQVMVVWRLEYNGTVATNFGGAGNGRYVYTGDQVDITTGHAKSMAIDSHNRIITTGTTSTPTPGFELTVWRLR